MVGWTNVATVAGKSGYGVISKIKYFLLFFIFFIMIMNAVIISVQNRDLGEGVQYLGKEFLLSTERLGELSQNVIDEEGIWSNSNGFFKNIWHVICYFWNVFKYLIIIYFWLKVLSWFILKIGIWDDSKTSVAFELAILIFILTQMLFVGFYTDKPIMTPILCFWQFIKSVPFVFKPIMNITDKYMGSNNTSI